MAWIKFAHKVNNQENYYWEFLLIFLRIISIIQILCVVSYTVVFNAKPKNNKLLLIMFLAFAQRVTFIKFCNNSYLFVSLLMSVLLAQENN